MPPCGFQMYSPWTTTWSPTWTGTGAPIEMLCSTSIVRSCELSFMMNCSCVPVLLLRSGSKRTTVPSAVTSTCERWFWKSEAMAASSGELLAAPQAASRIATANAAAARLTDFDLAHHLGVDRAVIFEVAGLAEGDGELVASVLQAGIKRPVIRRHAVVDRRIDPVPGDAVTGLYAAARRLVRPYAVRFRVDLNGLGRGRSARAARRIA